jgi:hypothetical protein
MPAANPFSNYRPDLTRPLLSADVPFHRRSHTNAPIVAPTGGVLMEGFEAAVLIVFGTIVLVTAASLMFRSR